MLNSRRVVVKTNELTSKNVLSFYTLTFGGLFHTKYKGKKRNTDAKCIIGTIINCIRHETSQLSFSFDFHYSLDFSGYAFQTMLDSTFLNLKQHFTLRA